MEQWRFQQRYQERLREDQLRLQNWSYNDYGAYNYRYSRGGNYYETSQYGADLLRQAVNNGYDEGFRAGLADRQDGWRGNYQDSYAYQDATFGYNGYYVGLGEYQYYFREGFQRGYEDGFYGRYQYGSYNNGTYSILGTILRSILNFESY
jgi:hypothetical protein